MSRPTARVIAAPQSSPAGNWISRAAVATVAALAGLAGALSYSHMRQLAQDHGQAGWHAHVFPLSVDGLEIVASLVLLTDHRSGRRPGWLPWAALVIGTVGSVAANVVTAEPSTISRVIAGWPALALVIAVKLLSGLLGGSSAEPAQAAAGLSHDDPSRSAGPRRAAIEANTLPRLGAATRLVSPLPAETPTHNPAPSDEQDFHLGDLLPAARAARNELNRAGYRLTRDALAARLRQSGHPVSNSRLTPLLHALRSEAGPPSLAD